MKCTVYSEYSALVAAASEAYDALVALESSAAEDKDIKAAKAEFDTAAAILAEKNALINGYADAVSAVNEYDAGSTLYSEWAAGIVAAQEIYEQLSSADDDITETEIVSEACKKLKTRLESKAAIDVVIKDVEDKTAAADLAYETAFGQGEVVYDETVNAALDAAEQARLAAAALNLTNDVVLADELAVLDGLHAGYDGVRYGHEWIIWVITWLREMP